jgi:hypothetical protein
MPKINFIPLFVLYLFCRLYNQKIKVEDDEDKSRYFRFRFLLFFTFVFLFSFHKYFKDIVLLYQINKVIFLFILYSISSFGFQLN